ncbi:nucleotide disphospho-sugar-binding domain-containing protein [Azonexus sp.]|uniref:glycosyltransferase n=1 Tax=Azonexus sp. TaxID=1872668 RepID=UPI00283A9735|nr:nucleotide disphospho-sugar-binding domain-containing protein [Azonexus sp.]
MIAWELGGAFGHLARCLRLAEGLRQRGHAVTLALKDVRLPAGQCIGQGFTVLPAPMTPQGVAGHGSPANYADVLLGSGFADAHDVAARLNAWRGMLSLAQPDVLVADYAPTAMLAAHLAGIPHLAIGNGFAIPPAVSPWPSIRPWEEIPEETLREAEARLNRVTDAAQIAQGHAATVRMRELFGADDILDTVAELDHYGERRAGRYVGPIVSLPQALRVDWQRREVPKVLAYLRPAVPGFAAILQALARLDADVLCVAPGMNPEAAKRVATRHLRMALTPVDLAPLLEVADLAVGYGNGGFSTQALLAGVPLAMRPCNVEQMLLARRIELLGAGKLLEGRLDADKATASMQELLVKPCYRQAANAFRDRHRQFSPSQAMEQSLSLIERTLAGGSRSNAHETQERPPRCLH